MNTDLWSGFAGYEWGLFFRSAGFGGLAAVVAASIAYAGVRRTVRSQREAARKQQWWDRARWALDLTLRPDLESRVVGLNVLDAMAGSEYAAEHEIELVVAATASSLDSYEEQLLDRREERAPGTTDEAHLNQDNDTDDDTWKGWS